MQLNKKRGMCSQEIALNLIHLLTVNPSYLVIIEKIPITTLHNKNNMLQVFVRDEGPAILHNKVNL
jgi:hypothetical protein